LRPAARYRIPSMGTPRIRGRYLGREAISWQRPTNFMRGYFRKTVVAMAVIGWAMSLVFAYLYFNLFKSLKLAVSVSDTPAAAQAMARIRPVMATNLALGMAASAIGALHPVLG